MADSNFNSSLMQLRPPGNDNFSSMGNYGQPGNQTPNNLVSDPPNATPNGGGFSGLMDSMFASTGEDGQKGSSPLMQGMQTITGLGQLYFGMKITA